LKEAQRQNEVTASLLKEAQLQNQQSLMPVVVLMTDTTPGFATSFLVKNDGTGPALNVVTASIVFDKVRFEFHHHGAIGIGEQHRVSVLLEGRPGEMRLPDFVQALRQIASNMELHTTISYQSIKSDSYTTHHTLKLTSDQKDLIIRFDGFQRA
jgi:hypothetical protein